jgi:glycosyltransferase involved in cell wall biosynthesis
MIREIENDPARVAELRRKGPERIRANYTWEKIANQYDALFREVQAR